MAITTAARARIRVRRPMMVSRVEGPDSIGAGPAGPTVLFMGESAGVCGLAGSEKVPSD